MKIRCRILTVRGKRIVWEEDGEAYNEAEEELNKVLWPEYSSTERDKEYDLGDGRVLKGLFADCVTNENVKVTKARYNYFLIKDGETIWESENPTVLRIINGGYLQDILSDYSFVYDYDGNKILRKLNNMLLQD